ncbi:ShTK domain protein [Trichostrongylus colubriformis]|uniref:ShTK domain protein n=1 Tax=Trichostrongylus colubriformis TaxID=6319 RepID=A0AAN8FQQ7_TRICO
MMLALFGALLLTYMAEAQYLRCGDGGIGPCVDFKCPSPEKYTCITTAPDVHICCENSQVGDECQDFVNPRTGVSDCPSKAYLCNNALYYNLMTQQCPKTCNRCQDQPTTAPSTGCRDLVDPKTGVSNCAQMQRYCHDPFYLNLMKQQCPKTCGYCT